MIDGFRMARAGLAVFLAIALTNAATAQIVYTGLDYSFTKPDFANHLAPQNQDRLQQKVWLTRADLSGLFNVRLEDEWSNTSPDDTEWATDLNNPGDTISATNWAALTFDPWIDAYGGPGGMTLPERLIGRDAVLHLITDDIYLDLQFTSWTTGSEGAGFSYLRSVILVPEPRAIFLALPAVFGLTFYRRQRIYVRN